MTSSRSARSRGSAVLARAQEYNRIIDEKNKIRSRSQSHDRHHVRGGGSGNYGSAGSGRTMSPTREQIKLHRSKSAPRTSGGNLRLGDDGNDDDDDDDEYGCDHLHNHYDQQSLSQMNQRERATASVRASSPMTLQLQQSNGTASGQRKPAITNHRPSQSQPFTEHQNQHQHQHKPQSSLSPQQSRYKTSPTPSQKSASARTNKSSTHYSHHNPRQQSNSQRQQRSSPKHNHSNSTMNKENNYRDRDNNKNNNYNATMQSSKPSSNSDKPKNQSKSNRRLSKSPTKSRTHTNNTNHNPDAPNNNDNQQAIVTPELLVDALSGHEDGLLAIAERLMEHYDSGYDIMGEAIIDAFADVQKLFQHVVEAAHMEGAAYEAGRREEEIERLKRALGGEAGIVGGIGNGGLDHSLDHHHSNESTKQQQQQQQNPNSSKSNTNASSPVRHEEFVDQDVRDVLLEAVRKGQSYKDTQKYQDCYHLYEQACNSASALLPVDSDHRGRLQLSIARAESMNAERACAILKYVMDDVLRSGLNSNSKVVMPDPSQRGDCVLSRPPPTTGKNMDGTNVYASGGGDGSGGVVLQSSEEALASMVEEMKEILSAPVYDNSPLQSVADRFWTSLSEAQRNNMKTEERLEQKLGELKGDFLLAKMVRVICA